MRCAACFERALKDNCLFNLARYKPTFCSGSVNFEAFCEELLVTGFPMSMDLLPGPRRWLEWLDR